MGRNAPPQILYSLSGNWIETQTFDAIIASSVTTIELAAPSGSSILVSAVAGNTIEFIATNRGLQYGGGAATTIATPQAHLFTGIAADASGNATGGSNNFVGGAGAGTGIQGPHVQFNGHGTCSFTTVQITAANENSAIFVCPNRPMLLTSASLTFTAAAGGTSTLNLTHETGTEAPTTGVNLMNTFFDLNAAINTTQAGSLLAATAANLSALALQPGDRVSFKLSNGILASAGVTLTLGMLPW